ncbi:MAG: hypothetical protein FWG98_15350 [Candidatus Cloacimonetes bacterium]|nr:hypothetical protein [Candidatus Cloacimonadota bacterium]
MENVTNNVSLNELILKIQVLPIESLNKVYDFVSKISEQEIDNQNKPLNQTRACCKPDSILNTRTLPPFSVKFKRDDLYD